MTPFKLLLSVGVIFTSVQCSHHNYCEQTCGNKQTHTLCKYPFAGPGANCSGYIAAGLSLAEKQRVLARLNMRRSQAAVGKLLNFPAASNMMKLRWVEDLAKSAQRWADQCVPPSVPERLDECRDMFAWTAGQAVASMTGESPGLRVEALVDSWYMQSLKFQGNITYYQIPSDSRHRFEGFAQLMWAKSYMVGCGRARFMVAQGGRHLGVYRLVCNFAPRGALLARPVWMPGASCARCPSDTHCFSDYPGLCHYPNITDGLEDIKSEVYDSNIVERTDANKTYIKFKKGNDLNNVVSPAPKPAKRYGETSDLNVYLSEIGEKSSTNVTIASLDIQENHSSETSSIVNKIKLGNFTRDHPKIFHTTSMRLDPNSYFYQNLIRVEDLNNNKLPKTLTEIDATANKKDETETDKNTKKDVADENEDDDHDSFSFEERKIVLKKLLELMEDDYNEHRLLYEQKNRIQNKENIKTTTDVIDGTPESLKDLREAVDWAESEHEKQPIGVKVRRELRERMIEDSLTTSTTTEAPLPPMLEMMVEYFPFLGYERSSTSVVKGGLILLLFALLFGINV